MLICRFLPRAADSWSIIPLLVGFIHWSGRLAGLAWCLTYFSVSDSSSHSLCVSLCLFSFYKDMSHIRLGSTLIKQDSILTWFHLKILFSNKVIFTGAGGEVFSISFGEDAVQPTAIRNCNILPLTWSCSIFTKYFLSISNIYKPGRRLGTVGTEMGQCSHSQKAPSLQAKQRQWTW